MKRRWGIYILIPTLTAYLSMMLRLAQGEKTEEISFGIMAGLLADLLLAAAFRLIEFIRNRSSRKREE